MSENDIWKKACGSPVEKTPSDPSQHQGQRPKSTQIQDGCHPFQKSPASCSANELHSCKSFGNWWPGPQKLSQQGLRGSHLDVEGDPAYNAAYHIKNTFEAWAAGPGGARLPGRFLSLSLSFVCFVIKMLFIALWSPVFWIVCISALGLSGLPHNWERKEGGKSRQESHILFNSIDV